MFESSASYPVAIADGTDEGLQQGFDWCAEHMDEGHKLTLYVAAKSSSSNSPLVNEWLRRYSDVELATARGVPMVSRGPVLALWPSAQGLGKLLDRRGALTALCVASWNHTEVGPWVAAARPEILDSAQEEWGSTPHMQLHPDVEEEMLAVTQLIITTTPSPAASEVRRREGAAAPSRRGPQSGRATAAGVGVGTRLGW